MPDSVSSSIPARPLSGKCKSKVEKLSHTRSLPFLTGTMRLASLLLLLYWTSIFVGTHIPGHAMPKVGMSDKLMHFGAFAGLAFLLAWAIPTRKGRYLVHACLTFGIIAAYACLDELTQKFIPGRSCSAWDLLADITGAAAGIGLYWICRYILLKWNFGRLLIHRLSR